jgi:flagellar hook-associated protein 1 FlgK
LGDFYEAYLSKIGSEAGRAALMYEAQKNLTEQINEQRLSVMGVNIDEEMLDILKFNQAFNAMSRYVTTIDEMLDRIINNFGLVGR